MERIVEFFIVLVGMIVLSLLNWPWNHAKICVWDIVWAVGLVKLITSTYVALSVWVRSTPSKGPATQVTKIPDVNGCILLALDGKVHVVHAASVPAQKVTSLDGDIEGYYLTGNSWTYLWSTKEK